MTVAVPIRRAGVRFEARSPATPEALPRMDVGALAGFAACGPFDAPVAVDDPAAAVELFGPPLALPGGRTSHLHGALRSFFANGGRRCFVLRVGVERGLERTTFPLPGVLVRTGAGLAAAALPARSPGSAFDGLTVRCALQSEPVGVRRDADGTLHLLPRAGRSVAAGSLVQLRDAAGGATLAPVATVQGSRVELDLARGATFATPDGLDGFSPSLGAVHARRTEAGWALDVADPHVPAPAAGSTVTAELSGLPGGRLCLLVSGIGASPAGAAAFCVLGAGAWVADDPPPTVPATIASAELLTLELRVGRPGEPGVRLTTIGCAAPHPRWAGDLPSDAVLFGAPAPPEPGTLAAAAAAPRFPLAGDTLAAGDVLLPFALGPDLSPARAAAVPAGAAVVRCGLGAGGAHAFADAELAALSSVALVANATQRRAAGERLRGVHVLLHLDEATLCAAPDAVHPTWHDDVLPELPASTLTEPAPRPDPTDFARCDVRVLRTPSLQVVKAAATGRIDLAWDATDAAPATYEIQAAPRDSDLPGSDAAYRGDALATTLFVAADSVAYVRIRAVSGASVSDWSVPIAADCRAPAALAPDDSDSALAAARDVHAALLRIAAARGDLLAALALPAQTDAAGALEHAARLRAALAGEPRALGYGLLAHPWPLVADAAPLPPDGPALGLLARRARERGCWVAPAGLALRDALGLDPLLLEAERDALMAAQIDVLEDSPTGFQWRMQETLSDDVELRAVNVRRLIALLRRAAERRGRRWAFEPNDTRLRRAVQRSFEALLTELDARGAFAGPTPADRWRVDVLDDANDRDNGRLVVELRVAPSLPLRFLTIRLVLDGDRGVSASVEEER